MDDKDLRYAVLKNYRKLCHERKAWEVATGTVSVFSKSISLFECLQTSVFVFYLYPLITLIFCFIRNLRSA